MSHKFMNTAEINDFVKTISEVDDRIDHDKILARQTEIFGLDFD